MLNFRWTDYKGLGVLVKIETDQTVTSLLEMVTQVGVLVSQFSFSVHEVSYCCFTENSLKFLLIVLVWAILVRKLPHFTHL